MANKDWRDLEQLVAKIQRSLAPTASVEHNVNVMGVESETERQIDVLVKQRIGQYEMTIAIDCKDYKRPVDVKGVEEFAGMVRDIRANKGVLVCPAGFTASAKKTAKKLQMELYRPVDTDDHKWKVQPSVPALFEFVRAEIRFGLSCSAPSPLAVSTDLSTLEPFAPDGTALEAPYEAAILRWNAGEYPTDVGLHEDVPIYAGLDRVEIDNGYGQRVPVELTVTLDVSQEIFFGKIPIDRVSGFLDDQTGLTVTNSFTVGAIDPDEVYNTWTRLRADELLPLKPVLIVRGLEGWESRAAE